MQCEHTVCTPHTVRSSVFVIVCAALNSCHMYVVVSCFGSGKIFAKPTGAMNLTLQVLFVRNSSSGSVAANTDHFSRFCYFIITVCILLLPPPPPPSPPPPSSSLRLLLNALILHFRIAFRLFHSLLCNVRI